MSEDQALEGLFYQYVHQVGEADPEWNREVLGYYVPHFAKCQRVLDVGCGQGEFLELLQAIGVEAVGIDVDAAMIDTCVRKGLEVVQVDVFEYLPACKGRFDGIFSSNVIEHLSAAEATRFVGLAFDALLSGGLLLAATPNPASPVVHLNEFWRDATHVRLYNRSLLEFLMDWAGFVEVSSDENPLTAWVPSQAMQAVPGRFRESASLRGALHWTVKTRHGTSSESTLAEPSPASSRESRSLRDNLSWQDRREALLNSSRGGSFLGRLIFSVRRRLARFLADMVLFEEFATASETMSDLMGCTKELSGALDRLRRALNQTSNGLVDVDQTLSEKSSILSDLLVATQEIEETLYHSHNSRMVTPREVFAMGVKPSPETGKTE